MKPQRLLPRVPRGLVPSGLVSVALLTTACGPKTEPDLTARLLFTATGTYDSRADEKVRLGAGRRRAVWQRNPPLPGRTVTVEYNSEARPAIWAVTVQAPEALKAGLLKENPASRAVQTPGGPAQLFMTGRLRDVLLRPVPGGVQLLTRGYATQYDSQVLPAFRPAD
ncbi:hypothetical protein ACFSC4_01085 [Deinococcus malanensis]|uniref:hypothetical protein n=1 Tax=Deinococcus malanensis TaxID=1706855 RepID=UPI001E5A1713|nr:hypothetical protein [Deinococcus malanensis]